MHIARLLVLVLVLVLGWVSGCAGALARDTHPDGLARTLLGEEARIQSTCATLADPAAPADGSTAQAALAAEQRRDACRLAVVLQPTLRASCQLDQAKAAIESAMAKAPPPWLPLVLTSSGSWNDGRFDAAVFSSRFDFSRVLARKLAEIGDRASSYAAQVGQSFGRFAGAVQLGVDLLVAEVTASAVERLLDQPAMRALTEPTEVARLACAQLDDGQTRPLVTRRLLKRAILRLQPRSDIATPGQLCTASVRPASCGKLVGTVTGPAAAEAVDRQCRLPQHRGRCDYLWFLVAARHAAPLQRLCAEKDAPPVCRTLGAARQSGQDIDDVCMAAALPHERARCRQAVRHFAVKNEWHDNAAENACWSNPARCARIKHHVLPSDPPARPLLPPERGAQADEGEGRPLDACFTAAVGVCADRCTADAGGCPAAFDCIRAACEIVATRPAAAAVDGEAELARLRTAIATELDAGLARRADLVGLGRDIGELGRSERATADAIARVPAEVGNVLRQVLPELAARGGDASSLRRLEGVLDKIEAKQAQHERGRARQDGLAQRLEQAARAAGFEVRKTDAGVSVVLTNVLFEDGASDLTDDARSQVCKLAGALASSDVAALLGEDYRIDIVGYSSPTAIVTSRRKEDSNMLLSIDRAYAAYDWLTKNPDKSESRCGQGRCRDARSCPATIPQGRVTVVGRGYNDTAVGSDDVLRRVEIQVVMPELSGSR